MKICDRCSDPIKNGCEGNDKEDTAANKSVGASGKSGSRNKLG